MSPWAISTPSLSSVVVSLAPRARARTSCPASTRTRDTWPPTKPVGAGHQGPHRAAPSGSGTQAAQSAANASTKAVRLVSGGSSSASPGAATAGNATAAAAGAPCATVRSFQRLCRQGRAAAHPQPRPPRRARRGRASRAARTPCPPTRSPCRLPGRRSQRAAVTLSVGRGDDLRCRQQRARDAWGACTFARASQCATKEGRRQGGACRRPVRSRGTISSPTTSAPGVEMGRQPACKAEGDVRPEGRKRCSSSSVAASAASRGPCRSRRG